MKWTDPSSRDANPDVDYFQQLADGAPVMIWMSGMDMGCFYFNRAWLDFRGRTTEQEFGNGWAEGVHPEDLERCVQHYIACFQRRVAFAMSYRLQHHSGEFRWILDRGAPHHGADGAFLGFYGGCAELSADPSVCRMSALRDALQQMHEFADRLATAEAPAVQDPARGAERLKAKAARLRADQLSRQNAASQIGKLASDILTFDRIPNGSWLR